MIAGIGIDIVSIGRISRWMKKPGMIERFFHPDEIRTAQSRGSAGAESLAARFAAKEAFGKALGTGLAGLRLRDIKVLNDLCGKPSLRLEGSAEEHFAAFGGGIIHCSLSHEGDYAVALVIIERNPASAG
ncbi:MAG: holo-ACP synthase [Spirochaetaceae bacterium]|nr:holo-ACP synthase [Spirochaetaceae bacterium]